MLDALPVGTVIRDSYGLLFDYGSDGEGGAHWWHEGAYDDPDDIGLPAMLLYHPDDEGEQ